MLADMPRSQSVSNRMLTQDGVISRTQAAALGIGPARARYWCEVGRWVAVHPGVYRTAETTLSDRARIRAASLWGGSRTWVSGAAAVYWWGYTEIPPSQVELIVPRSRYLKPSPGIVVRRADLDPLDVICHDRVPMRMTFPPMPGTRIPDGPRYAASLGSSLCSGSSKSWRFGCTTAATSAAATAVGRGAEPSPPHQL
jgi:hypothetical protein